MFPFQISAHCRLWITSYNCLSLWRLWFVVLVKQAGESLVVLRVQTSPHLLLLCPQRSFNSAPLDFILQWTEENVYLSSWLCKQILSFYQALFHSSGSQAVARGPKIDPLPFFRSPVTAVFFQSGSRGQTKSAPLERETWYSPSKRDFLSHSF